LSKENCFLRVLFRKINVAYVFEDVKKLLGRSGANAASERHKNSIYHPTVAATFSQTEVYEHL
jgi:hypothetical protein